MSSYILNGKNYKVPELDFNAVCDLEDKGIKLMDIGSGKISIKFLREIIALSFNGNSELAGVEIQNHLIGGGKFEDLSEGLGKAIEDFVFNTPKGNKVDGYQDTSQEKYTNISLKERIWTEFFPEALRVGVSYELFWKLTPFKLTPFIKAEELKRDDRLREYYIQGMYLYSAIQSFAPILVSFPERGAKPLPYPDTPFGLEQEVLENNNDEKIKKLERGKLIYTLNNIVKSYKK